MKKLSIHFLIFYLPKEDKIIIQRNNKNQKKEKIHNHKIIKHKIVKWIYHNNQQIRNKRKMMKPIN